MCKSLDINYIVTNLQKILDRTHTSKVKRQIKVKSDRISFACPVCGDSRKNEHAKRGHIYLNNLFFKCYNEDCKGTFTSLCKQYDIALDPNKRMELIDYIDTQFHSYQQVSDEWVNNKLDKLIKLEDLQAWFDDGQGPLQGFSPVQFGSATYMYLLNRGIPKELIGKLFYEGIKHNGKWSEPYLVFVNVIDDKVLGMQERNLKSGYQRSFKIWSFKELYDNIYETRMDEIEAIVYNKLSYLYNILNINFEDTVNIFEGYIDSIFMPNSIGAVGINTDYTFLISNDVDIRFFFDNDKTGKKKSLEWLKMGYNVFLWEKLINDLAKKKSDPHKYKKWFNNNIKDLNKLMQLQPMHFSKLEKYFSSSLFDTIYINYNKKFEKYKDRKNLIVDWDKKINDLKW